jgi:hypothetical protein
MQKLLILRRPSTKVRVEEQAWAALHLPRRCSREDRKRDEHLCLAWDFGLRPEFMVERSA